MVTGICIPCASMGVAAQTAIDYHIGSNILKLGKSVNQWYVVVIYNQFEV